MIYHHVFTPVRDGTCWNVYVDRDATRLKGLRRDCFKCHSALTHTTCVALHESVEGMSVGFGISDNYTHSGILQTCNTVLIEALPVSLASMHINISWSPNDTERALGLLLKSMRQPKGARVSTLTCRYYNISSADGDDLRCLSHFINRAGIRVGHLILYEITESAYLDIGKLFIATLDRLDHKPASVEWTTLTTSATTSYQYESRITEFNEAAGRWLAKLAKVKAADLNARLPLLRDFLPQYFEESAD
jgi:hypothetical protein